MLGVKMSVTEAIAKAKRMLDLPPVEEGHDPRWQAIIDVGEHLPSDPANIWQFIEELSDTPDEDLQAAVATCLLEHLLEYHFDQYFPEVERLTRSSPHFAKTFSICSAFGQSELPENRARFDALKEATRDT
jgi:hypothetical protein